MHKFIPALSLFFVACGPTAAPTTSPEPASPIEQESKDAARAGDEQMIAAQKAMDEEIDRNQGELEKALKLALGQVPAYQGGQNPYPASEALAELRKAKIDLRLEPVLDAEGKPVADQFLELKDSYTDKVQALSRKIAEGKASKKEMQFVQSGVTHIVKLNDLKGQVRAATMPALQAGWMVTTGSMTTMATVAHMVRTRRQMEMEWTEGDYTLVQGLLERQSRREAVAAVSIGLLATYQAVLTVGGDPKMLDDVANGTLAALPLQGSAALEDAKAYVDNFEANAQSAHVQYEDQMRKTFGDAEYEAKYKAQIDATFNQIKDASSAKSATELIADTSAQYEVDLKACARGEKPGPSSMVGPGKCKEAQSQADASGNLSPKALAAMVGGTADVEGLAKKGLALVLDKLPGGGAIKRALEGVQALRRGDPSKALQLAADLIPMPGPAKMALGAAAKLTEALPAMRKKAKQLGRT